MCCVVGAITGWVYILGLLFSAPTVDVVLGPNLTGNIVSLYQLAAPGGNSGALALTILLIINLYFAGGSSVTVTTRIGYAMARDGAFPGSKYIFYVNERTKSPIYVVLMVYVVDAVLLLIQLGSTTAFASIVSITTIGYIETYIYIYFFSKLIDISMKF